MPPTSSMGCGAGVATSFQENITLKHYMNTTWVARPIAKDMPSNEELSVTSFKPGMDENNKKTLAGKAPPPSPVSLYSI